MPALLFIPAFSYADGKITLVIEPVFNGRPLQTGEQAYVNDRGDSLYVDLLKFYLTQIKLGNSNCKECNHLFDSDDSSTYSYSFAVLEGNYTTLSFILGVDSVTNTSGAYGGDLDPTKGMYWAWNSGYIMAKLEGHSRVCPTLHHAFEYHIGGYMPPYNTARIARLQLPSPIVVNRNENTVVRLRADVAAWFRGIDIAKVNNVVIPGKEAAKMADNYAKMFSLQ